MRRVVTGTVLDVRVFGVSGGNPTAGYLGEQRFVASALNKITGKDFGVDHERWKSWLDSQNTPAK